MGEISPVCPQLRHMRWAFIPNPLRSNDAHSQGGYKKRGMKEREGGEGGAAGEGGRGLQPMNRSEAFLIFHSNQHHSEKTFTTAPLRDLAISKGAAFSPPPHLFTQTVSRRTRQARTLTARPTEQSEGPLISGHNRRGPFFSEKEGMQTVA